MSQTEYVRLVRPYVKGFVALLVMVSPFFILMRAGFWAAEYIWAEASLPTETAWTLPFLVGLCAGMLGIFLVFEVWFRTNLSEYLIRMENTSETLSYPLQGDE